MGAGTNCGCRLSSFLNQRRMNRRNPAIYVVTSNSMKAFLRPLHLKIIFLMLSTKMKMSDLHFVLAL